MSVSHHVPGATIRAVDGVSLSIGQSGCGKSTLARALIGLVRAPGQVAGGSLAVNGNGLGAMAPLDARRIRRSPSGSAAPP